MKFRSSILLSLTCLLSSVCSTDPTPEELRKVVAADSTVSSAARQLDTYVRCQAACTFLSVLLYGKVALPKSKIYEAQNAYWSQQQANVNSVCRVTPSAAIDVSAALFTLKTLRCPFAVKSGGHAAFKGASNIENGITIDLANLNAITVSQDKSQASIGAGSKWIDVYSKLDPLGISAVGGRLEDIGVGGLTLGGGISYFSSRYGFASDNVNAFEIVLADGSIKTVTQRSYPDLYWALRGGGNNFGIVTRFDLKTFPQGQLWGGSLYIMADKVKQVFNALTNFAVASAADPYAALWVVCAYQQAQDMWLFAPKPVYGKPVVAPPIFKEFLAIPSIGNNTRTANLTSLVTGTNFGYDYRQSYWTATFKNDAALQERIFNIFQEEIAPLKDIESWLPTLVFQPFSKTLIEKFSQNGGNSIGIKPEDGPLILINIALQWQNPADDARVLTAARNTVKRATAEAKSRKLDFRYLYQNYAAAEQKVFESYGPENHARLRAISKKYDPEGVFQKLQPGYFKLW